MFVDRALVFKMLMYVNMKRPFDKQKSTVACRGCDIIVFLGVSFNLDLWVV